MLWNGRLNRRHLLVRVAANSDSDGAFRSGGSLGDASSLLLLLEGRQSGREASSSLLLLLLLQEEDMEAPPSVSWRKAFM